MLTVFFVPENKSKARITGAEPGKPAKYRAGRLMPFIAKWIQLFLVEFGTSKNQSLTYIWSLTDSSNFNANEQAKD